jgi:VWFA-related protein
LFVDALHLSTSSFIRAKQQLKQFVGEQITDQDLVAVVTTSSSLGVLQQFMRDRKMLKYAIDKITLFSTSDSMFTGYIAARVLSNDAGAVSAATQILFAEEGVQPPESYVRARATEILAQESNTRRAALLTLRAVCDRMAEMPGQRMIAFVSDGFTMLDEGGGSDNQDLIAVTGRASRSGVVIYSFDAKGLEVPAEYQASVALTASALNSGDFSRYVSDSKLDQQGTLRTLAYDTGGEAYLNRNFLNKWLQAMLDSNRVYYAIAYYPAENTDKKKFRNVTIRVKDHPGYVVRTQKGYFPAEEKKEDFAETPRQKLFQAMLSPLPVTSITVTSAADFLAREGDDEQVTVQIHLDGNALQYQKQDESFLLDGEVVITAFDSTGKLIGTIAQSLKAGLSAEQAQRAKREGFRYNKRLALKPGFYQLRVGVRDVASNQIGTSMCWVEVPDLQKSKLALSSLFLGREGKSQERTETPAGQDKQTAAPTYIIGRAPFKSGDIAYYRFVVYDAQDAGEAESLATMKVEIIAGETVVYQGGWQPLAARTVRKDTKGIEAGGRLQLGLEPGVYSLRVTLKDPKLKKTVQQTADFEIEP